MTTKRFLEDRNGNLSSTRLAMLASTATGLFIAAGPTAANIFAGEAIHESVDPFLVLSVLGAGFGGKCFQAIVESREGSVK